MIGAMLVLAAALVFVRGVAFVDYKIMAKYGAQRQLHVPRLLQLEERLASERQAQAQAVAAQQRKAARRPTKLPNLLGLRTVRRHMMTGLWICNETGRRSLERCGCVGCRPLWPDAE